MLTLDMLKEIAHSRNSSSRDIALAALAFPDLSAKSLDALRRSFADAGVSRVEQRQLPSTLSRAGGFALRTPAGWELSSRGRSRVQAMRADFSSIRDTGETLSIPDNRSPPVVFIGHGHSPVWREVKDFVVDRLNCRYEEFNREPAAGISNEDVLQKMLGRANFALLVMTAEDEQIDGKVRARQNVIHECGLFQSRLGFRKAIVLREEECEKFSNHDGISDIPFPMGRVSAAFEDIRRVMERERLI